MYLLLPRYPEKYLGHLSVYKLESFLDAFLKGYSKLFIAERGDLKYGSDAHKSLGFDGVFVKLFWSVYWHIGSFCRTILFSGF